MSRTWRELYLFVFVLLFAMSAAAEATRPQLVDVRDTQSAAATLIGAGIDTGGVASRPHVAGAIGELMWKVVRETTQDRARHVLYQQHLRNASGAEVPLAGAYVTAHFLDGRFIAAEGQQFTRVRIENVVRVSAKDAVRFSPQSSHERIFETVGERELDTRAAATELLLVPTTEDSFRYVYQAEWDRTHTAVIDAGDGTLLRIADASVSSNCGPSQPVYAEPAQGTPVRDDLANAGVRRSLYANLTFDRWNQGFTHEAHWPGDNWAIPNVTVYQYTQQPYFACNPNAGGEFWTVFPVSSYGYNRYWIPYYANGAWKGSVAGDAMHRTRKTMEAFRTLGRYSYNGNMADANIIIESQQSVPGTFFRASEGMASALLPNTDIVGIAPANYNGYNIVSSLDLVAHEWGHGVIFTSYSNFDLINNPVGQQLHEGFADVIGQTVEKMSEPEGPGVEHSSDWDIGEDASFTNEYLRSATRDDGYTGHTYLNDNVNNLFHRYDAQSGNTRPHDFGNLLNIVLYLMSNGGPNPSCARFGNCDITVTPIQSWMAQQILFDVVQWYANPGTQWEQLPTLASLAAFNRYAVCGRGGNAADLQHAVERAFAAVGYPRTTPAYTCQ